MKVNGKEYPLFYGGNAYDLISQYARANNMVDINTVFQNAGVAFYAQVAFVGITEYCRVNNLECDIKDPQQVIDGVKKMKDYTPASEGYLNFVREFFNPEDSEGELAGEGSPQP